MVDDSGSTASVSEICDHCGAVVNDETGLYTLVPDSSKVHPNNPRYDGKRLVVACGAEHLAELQAEYDARPWIDEELWTRQDPSRARGARRAIRTSRFRDLDGFGHVSHLRGPRSQAHGQKPAVTLRIKPGDSRPCLGASRSPRRASPAAPDHARISARVIGLKARDGGKGDNYRRREAARWTAYCSTAQP